MTATNYDVNGLLKVVAGPNVREEILRQIDFQIGYFKQGIQLVPDCRPTISVRPFSELEEGDDASRPCPVWFYECHGRPGKDLIDKPNRLGIVREEAGFTIYADYPNFLINIYIQLLLAPMGYTMVHAAGYVAPAGMVTLVAGAGGIGKTLLLGHAVNERGFKHMGDDVVILGKSGNCLPYPRAFVLKAYHREAYSETFQRLRLPRWNLHRVKRFLVANAPLMGVSKQFLRQSGLNSKVADFLRLHPHLATVPPEEIFGSGSISPPADLGRVIYLERAACSDFWMGPMNSGEMTNRLFSVIHHEWKEYLGHLLNLGALNVVNLNAYLQDVEQNLRGALARAELLHLLAPEGAGPTEMINYLEAQELF
jgi:hypothetical protein